MKPLTARAKRVDNGEWVVGYPFETWNYRRTERVTYLALDNPCEVHADGAIMNLRAVMIDPATLGYATGKLDKHGKMIYDGMEIKAFNSISSVEQDEDGIWKLFRASPALKILRGCEYLLRCESSDLEIMKEGE